MRQTYADIAAGLRLWRQWSFMAITEIKMHYRRSVLGPFWLTLNALIMVGALGAVYGLLFKMDTSTYIPYVGAGYLAWTLIAAFVNEGGMTFVQNATMIKNVNNPLTFFVFKMSAKQIIVFVHQLGLMVPIYILYPVNLDENIVYCLPAIVLYAIDGAAVCALVGMICARFRDIPNVLSSLMQVIFFTTPIFWPAENLRSHPVVEYNVFYHFIEIVRRPLLGHAPRTDDWVVALAASGVIVLVSLVAFARYRARIVHAL